MNEMKPILSRWLLANHTILKNFTFWKVSFKLYKFRVPVYKGFPMNEMEPNFKRWLVAKYTTVISFAFWKVSVKLYNLRVPVFKGVPLPWMKWYTSFNDDRWPTIRVSKSSLSEKWVLNYTTSGFPFLKGFPSHEWNETRRLAMIGGQLYECEKFRFLKSEW